MSVCKHSLIIHPSTMTCTHATDRSSDPTQLHRRGDSRCIVIYRRHSSAHPPAANHFGPNNCRDTLCDRRKLSNLVDPRLAVPVQRHQRNWERGIICIHTHIHLCAGAPLGRICYRPSHRAPPSRLGKMGGGLWPRRREISLPVA